MKIISKVLLVMLMVFTLAGSTTTVNEPPIVFDEQSQTVALKGKVHRATLHRIYEQAWQRASTYTELLPDEMPKFPEKTVHWTMKIETWEVDQDRNGPIWYTDLFVTSNSRILAWYKTDSGVKIEHGIALPVNARIEMQVTRKEIKEHTYTVENILVHEFIHYIHHMRAMNLKGWITIWPGDGHNYMNYLKYVKGHDVQVNKY